MFSIFKRFVTNIGKVRPDMPEGCPEGLDWELICWVWNFNKTHRNRLYQLIGQYPDKEVHIFRSRKQVKNFIKSI